MKKTIIILSMIITGSIMAQKSNPKLFPCIWFNNNTQEAITFYSSIFDNVEVISANQNTVDFTIEGTKFMGLNGGSEFSPNPGVSYFVYCENNHEKIEKLYQKLQTDGFVLMPLGTYDWSSKYAWVQDRYGVNWQLDIDAINNTQKVVPTLLFTKEKANLVKEAAAYYINIFKNSQEIISYAFPKESPSDEETLLFSQVKLEHTLFNLISGGNEPHPFDFSEGNSFVILCDTQEEIDYYWDLFAKEGKEGKSGWIQDKYGIWWQVIPSALKTLLNHPSQGAKVAKVLESMNKIEFEVLLNTTKK